MPSPACTVNGSATANGVDVSTASTITIQLASLAGVSSWSITCIGRDEVASAPTLSVNSGTRTATFTSGSKGSAYLFESVVNGGVDANGTAQSSYTTRFAVFVLTAGGARVGAYELTTEGNSTCGWTAIMNAAVRRSDVASSGGAFSSMPSPATAGRIYVATDSPTTLWVDDGTEHRPLIAGATLGYRPPIASVWTAYNAGTATMADSSGALAIYGASDAAITVRGWEISYSNSTAYVEARGLEPLTSALQRQRSTS